MVLKFSQCKAGKGGKKKKKSVGFLFIPYINIGNLVLPPNRGRLDELDSSQFILHRNGSLKKKKKRESPPFVRGADRAEHKMDLRCHSEPGGLMREERLLVGAKLHKTHSLCHGEMEVSLIMYVSQELSLIF